jgi:glucose-6-phosphate isomerase, archaeal
MQLIAAPLLFSTGQHLQGKGIEIVSRKLKDLESVFSDKEAYVALDPEQLVYEVESYLPVPTNTEGGLFYGITTINPGTVGNEYFMTKGHFHSIRNRAEMYFTISGEGMLILMDEKRNTHAERMTPGSVHYIHANIAHRTANIGDADLVFSAVWPADAGHDYDTIARHGFSKILVKQNGIPTLIDRA